MEYSKKIIFDNNLKINENLFNLDFLEIANYPKYVPNNDQTEEIYNETVNSNKKELTNTIEFGTQYDNDVENQDFKKKQSFEKISKNYFFMKKSFKNLRPYEKSNIFF